MKGTNKYFWLYMGAFLLTAALFWVGVRLRLESRWWSLLFLLPDGLAWAGWKERKDIPKEERFQASHLIRIRLDRILDSLPVLLLLAAVLPLLFG